MSPGIKQEFNLVKDAGLHQARYYNDVSQILSHPHSNCYRFPVNRHWHRNESLASRGGSYSGGG